MRSDQRVSHVGGVTCRVADSLEAIDLGKRADELGEAAIPIPPRIHILTEQDDLARAAVDQCIRLGENVAPRPRNFGATGVGHDAISTEFVAALLNGEERAWSRAAARRKR